MHNAGRVVSQLELGEQIHGDHSERGSNAIEVIVGRIRRKLGIAFIETRRGFGYVVGVTDA
jgi:DNA-binding response OmpR family regulator